MTAPAHLYFAYGSNLYLPRMRARAPSAFVYEVARLPGYRFEFRKLGRDGSGKADLVEDQFETVWGVLYSIDPGERASLDEAEGRGYRVEHVTVSTTTEHLCDAFTYRSRRDWRTQRLPFDWYRNLVATGARRQGLPEMYVTAIEALPAEPDPDTERAAANRARA